MSTPKPSQDSAALINAIAQRIARPEALDDISDAEQLVCRWQQVQSELNATGIALDGFNLKLRASVDAPVQDSRCLPSCRYTINADVFERLKDIPKVVAEAQSQVEKHANAIAMHFVKVTLPGLVSHGVIGQHQTYASGAARIQNKSISCDAICSTNRRQGRSVRRFERATRQQLPPELADLIEFSPMTTMQMLDSQRQTVECPSQFVMATIGPFVIATCPPLVAPSNYSKGKGNAQPANMSWLRTLVPWKTVATIGGICLFLPLAVVAWFQVRELVSVKWLVAGCGLMLLLCVLLLLQKPSK